MNKNDIIRMSDAEFAARVANLEQRIQQSRDKIKSLEALYVDSLVPGGVYLDSVNKLTRDIASRMSQIGHEKEMRKRHGEAKVRIRQAARNLGKNFDDLAQMFNGAARVSYNSVAPMGFFASIPPLCGYGRMWDEYANGLLPNYYNGDRMPGTTEKAAPKMIDPEWQVGCLYEFPDGTRFICTYIDSSFRVVEGLQVRSNALRTRAVDTAQQRKLIDHNEGVLPLLYAHLCGVARCGASGLAWSWINSSDSDEYEIRYTLPKQTT